MSHVYGRPLNWPNCEMPNHTHTLVSQDGPVNTFDPANSSISISLQQYETADIILLLRSRNIEKLWLLNFILYAFAEFQFFFSFVGYAYLDSSFLCLLKIEFHFFLLYTIISRSWQNEEDDGHDDDGLCNENGCNGSSRDRRIVLVGGKSVDHLEGCTVIGRYHWHQEAVVE